MFRLNFLLKGKISNYRLHKIEEILGKKTIFSDSIKDMPFELEERGPFTEIPHDGGKDINNRAIKAFSKCIYEKHINPNQVVYIMIHDRGQRYKIGGIYRETSKGKIVH